jgi:hypothetical protein
MEYGDRFDNTHIGMCAYCWEFKELEVSYTQVSYSDVEGVLEYHQENLCIECSHRIRCTIYPNISS